MAKDFSFDVVSEYDLAEMTNAVDQTQRELATRYDFKGTQAGIDWLSSAKDGVTLTGESRNQLNAVLDVFQGKLIKREISLKTLDLSKEPAQGGQVMKWQVSFQKGLDQTKAKQITTLVRDSGLKVKSQVQGEAVRISSASKDDLQTIMALLREQELDFPLVYNNYR